MEHSEETSASSKQTGKMAALLNSLFVVFEISFLPKYRVTGADPEGGSKGSGPPLFSTTLKY